MPLSQSETIALQTAAERLGRLYNTRDEASSDGERPVEPAIRGGGTGAYPGRSPAMKSSLTGDEKLPFRRGPVEFQLGTEADHEAVYQALLHVFHGPDRDAFLSALGDPDYDPTHRLLAKIDGRVASHLHLTPRALRYGRVPLSAHGMMWVGTLPEFRGRGLAQALVRLADGRARAGTVVLQALTTAMPQFYRPLGWGVCGRQTFGQVPSRNLPASGDAPPEARPGDLVVRPWRQVELGDLMRLYDRQYAETTGTVSRTEDYWRWIIGRRYAHVIWLVTRGDATLGYAFVKDHRVLELATDPDAPEALHALMARVRAEALERAYPDVTLHAPADHPAMALLTAVGGKVVDSEQFEGQVSMYHVPDVGGFLQAILPELSRRAIEADATFPLELGLTVGDHRYLVHVDRRGSTIEHDRLSRRHLTLTPRAFVRLALGHTGIDRALEVDGVETSTATAIDAARVLFPIRPIWRSPLDSATA